MTKSHRQSLARMMTAAITVTSLGGLAQAQTSTLQAQSPARAPEMAAPAAPIESTAAPQSTRKPPKPRREPTEAQRRAAARAPYAPSLGLKSDPFIALQSPAVFYSPPLPRSCCR